MLQITPKGQEHTRKVVDHYLPEERKALDELFAADGIQTKEMTDDEVYSLCEEHSLTHHIWYSLATIWEI